MAKVRPGVDREDIVQGDKVAVTRGLVVGAKFRIVYQVGNEADMRKRWRCCQCTTKAAAAEGAPAVVFEPADRQGEVEALKVRTAENGDQITLLGTLLVKDVGVEACQGLVDVHDELGNTLFLLSCLLSECPRGETVAPPRIFFALRCIFP